MVNTSLDGRFLAARHAKKNIVARLAIYLEWKIQNVACLICNTVEQGWDKHINGHRFFAFHNFRNSLSIKRAVFYISECFKKYFRQ